MPSVRNDCCILCLGQPCDRFIYNAPIDTQENQWLEEDTMKGVYIEVPDNGETGAISDTDDNTHEKLVDAFHGASWINGQVWVDDSRDKSDSGEETATISVLLGNQNCSSVLAIAVLSILFSYKCMLLSTGLDLTSSSWGLPEHISRLGALVYADLSKDTVHMVTNGALLNDNDHSELVIVVDEKDRLQYATADAVSAAIKGNTNKTNGAFKISDSLFMISAYSHYGQYLSINYGSFVFETGKAAHSLAIVSSTIGEQTEPVLPNLVSDI